MGQLKGSYSWTVREGKTAQSVISIPCTEKYADLAVRASDFINEAFKFMDRPDFKVSLEYIKGD